MYVFKEETENHLSTDKEKTSSVKDKKPSKSHPYNRDNINRDIIPDIPQALSTRELAVCFRVEAQTIRRAYCVNGHYMGLKPLKLPNGRLLWPRAAVYRVLGGCHVNR